VAPDPQDPGDRAAPRRKGRPPLRRRGDSGTEGRRDTETERRGAATESPNHRFTQSPSSLTTRRSGDPSYTVVVGRIVGTHGLRGEVKLLPETDFPERFTPGSRYTLHFPPGDTRPERPLELRATRPHKGVLLATFAGIASIEDAETLRGGLLHVAAAEAAPLPEGRFYIHQIVGLRVLLPDGTTLGRVTEVHRTPANDVYAVGSYLIPAIQDAVESIDPAAGEIRLRGREWIVEPGGSPDDEA
jgi:16S rRNA processing protein RimM